MSADIPSSPPAQLRAGDTAKWTRALADYLASDGWQLKYTLVATGGAYNFDATADGDGFAVNVPMATTADWVPGRYVLTEYVTNGTERATIGTSELQVLADLAAASEPADTRSHARKVLDAIEAWIESRAPTQASFEVAGRKLQNYPIGELLALRDRYRAEVRRETHPGGGRVQVRL